MPLDDATPPKPEIRPQSLSQLGRTRTDDYGWLKDDNWQEILRDPHLLRPDIRTYLEAENAYGEALLSHTKPLQTKLYEEMKGRIKEDDNSVPAGDGAYEYYSRYEIGAQHPIVARRPRSEAAFPAPIPSVEDTRAVEHVLLDEDARAKAYDYYETGGSSHSPDHALFAWSEDTQGSEYYTIFVKVVATDAVLGEPITSSTGDFGFSPCSQYLFWTWRDDNGRPAKIYRRPAHGGEDTLVYEEHDPGFFIGLSVLSDESFIEIGIGNQETSESWLIPASDPTATPVCVEARKAGVLYDIDHWNDRFIIRTNADEATDFKLMTSTASVPSRATWVGFIPHRPGVYITGVSAYKGHLVRSERENANLRIVITKASDLSEHSIDVAEEAYSLGSYGGLEYDTPVMRFGYTSPTTPSQTYDYDMNTRERVLRKSQVVPSGHNPNDYVARRLYATAPDGEQVPITLLMRKSTPIDGSAPVFLYGYGSYGASMDPSFSISRLSLVDRGFIHATAHVRGGSEKGFGWFQAARKFKKKNSFTDFIACAEHLIAQNYTAKGRIVAYGGSAGGMLMGAIANMRPDLWAGVIGAVPFIDVLNTMSDLSLPLTPPEWPEWGNPLEDEAAYDYIASYSPYDNISRQPYPAVLATGGLSDPRVTYWEPAKWVAKLRRFTTSEAPIILKMNMEAGHGGASGRFEYLKEIAFEYAFALWAVEKAAEWRA